MDGSVLFNITLNTFYWAYGKVRVETHADNTTCKEEDGSVLFNITLNTFYWAYGKVRVETHADNTTCKQKDGWKCLI